MGEISGTMESLPPNVLVKDIEVTIYVLLFATGVSDSVIRKWLTQRTPIGIGMGPTHEPR
jgi:hypothetical protein